ncbi:MAG TPA: glycosyltransferase family 2 protein [Anaerolineae bacterium]
MKASTVSQSSALPKVVVVMPAYNAAKTIQKTYADIPAGIVSQIILVDDVSQDETVTIAQQLGMQVVVHIQNRGYGGNQKTCYLHALAADADIVVMLHPDYQYDSRLIPELIQPIEDGRADLVLGSRFLSSGTLAGGMPLYKYISNRFLTMSENLVLRQHLSECHTGFRAYSRRLLETIPFVLNSENFVFDTQVIVQAVAFGFKIAEIAVPTRYFKEASTVNFQRSVVYGLGTVGALFEYSLDRTGLKKSARLRKKLGQVISRYHRQRLLRLEKPTDDEPPSPYPISLEL